MECSGCLEIKWALYVKLGFASLSRHWPCSHQRLVAGLSAEFQQIRDRSVDLQDCGMWPLPHLPDSTEGVVLFMFPICGFSDTRIHSFKTGYIVF